MAAAEGGPVAGPLRRQPNENTTVTRRGHCPLMTSPMPLHGGYRDLQPFAISITTPRSRADAPDQDGGLTPQPKMLRFLSNTAIIHCSRQVA